jgi:hypothetical protein
MATWNYHVYFDSFTREGKDEVSLTLVRIRMSSMHNPYIGNGLYIELRLLYGEIPKITYKYHQLSLKN